MKMMKAFGLMKEKSPAQKTLLLLAAAAVYGVLCFLTGTLFLSYDAIRRLPAASPPLSVGAALGRVFTDRIPFLLSLALFMVFLIALSIRFLRDTEPNPVAAHDERGIAYLEKGTYGTSRWMTEAEAKERFTVGPIGDILQPVFGQFTDDGDQVVAFSDRKTGGNRHVCLIGSSGSGKSTSYIKTEIIQSLLRGESVIATDPSVELYTDIAAFAARSGARVKVLNLSSPLNGNGWNCVAECISPETLSLDSGRLNDFADIYMRNAGIRGSSDSFWAAAELNLFKAVIGLCAFKRDTALNESYKRVLTQILRHGGYSTDQIREITSPIEPVSPIRTVRTLIDRYAAEAGYDMRLLKESLKAAEDAAPPFSISEVYNTVLAMDDEKAFREQFLNIPMTHPAAVAFKTYSSQEITEKIKASARMGLLGQLQIFNDTALKGVLSVDDLNFAEMGQVQTVFFLITPDKSDTLKPISSLAFSFLFKDLSDEWDREQAASRKEGRKNPRLQVSVIMDEFYSIGSIPSFPVYIATCRKRGLNVTVALQNIGQLYDLYGENGGDTILSCCDTLLFMGCNDLTTAQFVSAFCAGEATVKSQSFGTPNGLISALSTAPRQQIGISESSRKLITPDEVRRFTDGVLVVARGEQPLKLKRFPFFQHPAAKNGLLAKSNVYDLPSVLESHGYRDSFGGITLGDLVNPEKRNRAKENETGFAEKLAGIIVPSPFDPVNIPVPESPRPKEDEELPIQKARYTCFQEVIPVGSDTPLVLDFSREDLFLPGNASAGELSVQTGRNRKRASKFD